MIYCKYADDASKTEPAIEALNKKYDVAPGELIDFINNIDADQYNELQKIIEERHQENVLQYLEGRGKGNDSSGP